ncbi:hypothetical protein B0T19DRAFT_437980 [Cercophora scortea]|uniref:Uncharacterized protein n=1 Tax=Cercophora scortea TaxID=314031 RepID=A0AAE0J5G9_9PEZI|nr:hypothetical protein B0T19DRAFT_437980 [Cercophora scortea]
MSTSPPTAHIASQEHSGIDCRENNNATSLQRCKIPHHKLHDLYKIICTIRSSDPRSNFKHKPITTTEANSSTHITLPVGALVGIVIGSCIVVAAAAFFAYKCWSRRRGRKEEERAAATRDFLSSEPDHLPSPTLPTTVMARRRFITGFDEAGGQVPDPGAMAMLSPLEYKQQASAASPSSMGFSETSAMISELDSTPIGDARWSAATELENKPAGIRTPTASQGPTETLRGTLSSTRGDRESGTYVNDWTRFQNIQD